MSQKVNGTANPDAQVMDAAHKLASTHIKTPVLSPPNGVTPESETELHSPPHNEIKPPSQSHLHPLSAVAENATADQVSLNETPDARYTSQSMAASVGSRGPETSGAATFHGSKSVSDQAFPFPNGEFLGFCVWMRADSQSDPFTRPMPLVHRAWHRA